MTLALIEQPSPASVPMRARTVRHARKEDAAQIARLFLISSDGLAAYIWSRLAAPGETVADAVRWAGELAGQAPAALAAIKALVNHAAWPDLDAQLERERDAFVSTMFEPASRALVAGFLESSRTKAAP